MSHLPDRASIPILAVTDVLVVEGTLSACALAGRLAERHHRVLLACTGASPGRELALEYRAWLEVAERNELPSSLAAIVEPAAQESVGRTPLDLALFTTGLEDWLIDRGVHLLYDQTPAGLLRDPDGAVRGAVFAGKAGLFAVAAGHVIDASETATLAQIAGGPLASADASSTVLERAVTLGWYMRDAPAEGGQHQLTEDVTARGCGPWRQWTFRIALDSQDPGFPGRTALQLRCRILQLAPELRSEPGWQRVRWVRPADALTFPSDLLQPPSDVPEGLHLLHPPTLLGSATLATHTPGQLWQSGLDQADRSAPFTLPHWTRRPESLAHQLERWHAETAPPGTGSPPETGHRLGFTDPRYPLARFGGVPWDGRMPEASPTRVLVSGGGTAGMPAAAEAAALGLPTRLLEKHADVGGTNTVGGVAAYWYGRRTGYLEKHDAHLSHWARSAGIGAGLAKLDLLLRAGADVHLRTVTAGLLQRDRQLSHVIATTAHGLIRHGATHVLDASGDADLPAWSGHPYTYGIGRDESTMWYSFGKFKGAKPEASREYFACVDLRDPDDLTRSIIASRRRDGIYGRGDIPQFYLAPREGRHIQGRTTVTYRDLLRSARPADTLLLCRANFDIKGPSSSDLAMAGFVEPDFHRNYDCALPYRAMLPERLDNVVVLGKAYSVTHDALALARMQRDMIAMGAAAAHACALADAQPICQAPIPELQQRLIDLGILYEPDLTPPDPPRPRQIVDALDAGEIDLADQIHALEMVDQLEPELRPRLRDTRHPERQRVAARLLHAARPEAEARDVLLAAIDRALRLPELPELHDHKSQHDRPDHGWAPWPCYDINLLAQNAEPELIPRLQQLAARIAPDPAHSDKHYHYLESIAYAVERLADPACIPMLCDLLDRPYLQNRLLKKGDDPRRRADHVRDRYAYLRLSLARALARCGDERGCHALTQFLEDQRPWLARAADAELCDLAARTSCGDRSPQPYRTPHC